MFSIFTVSSFAASSTSSAAPSPGLFRIDCIDETATLLVPLSPAAVAFELYGNRGDWKRLLRPFNRYLLADCDPLVPLQAGTRVHISPPDLTARLQNQVILRQQEFLFFNLHHSTIPFIARISKPLGPIDPNESLFHEPVCADTDAFFNLRWQNVIGANPSVNWQVFYDPGSNQAPSRTYRRSDHFILNETSHQGYVFSLDTDTLGAHYVVAEVFDNNRRRLAKVKQVVVTSDEKAAILAKRPHRPLSTSKLLADLSKRKPKSKYKERIDKIKEWTAQATRLPIRPIYAHYFSSSGDFQSFPLCLYLFPQNLEPKDDNDAPLEVSIKLLDFTFPAINAYQGTGSSIDEAIADAAESYADDAPLPTGKVVLRVDRRSLPYGLYSEKLFTVDVSNTFDLSNIFGYLSTSVTVIAVGAAALGQGEIALPAFYVSGVLGGMSAAAQIADRWTHENLDWDIRTGLNVVDIVGAVTVFPKTARWLSKGKYFRTEYALMGRIDKGNDVAQIVFLGEQHRKAISVASDSDDPAELNRAIYDAMLQGAVMLVVNKAKDNISPELVLKYIDYHRMASGGANPPGGPADTGGNPLNKAHDQRMDALPVGELAPTTPPADASSVTIPEGNYLYQRTDSFDQAYQAYDEALRAVDHTREVGIYRNQFTDEYQVVVGTEVSVGLFRRTSETDNAWEGVLHFHPDGDTVGRFRLPSEGDLLSLRQTPNGRDRIEFIESPTPNGGRARTGYRIHDSGEITIYYDKGSGQVEKTYSSFKEFKEKELAKSIWIEKQEPTPANPNPDQSELYRTLMWEAADKYGHTLPFPRASGAFSYGDYAMASGAQNTLPSNAEIKALRSRMKDIPEVFGQIWDIYRALPRKRLTTLARTDPMARSVLDSRLLPNTPLDNLTKKAGRYSLPHLAFQLQEHIQRFRLALGIVRRGRSPIAADDPVQGGTVGVAVSDIPGVEDPSFGASRKAGGEFNPDSPFAPPTDFESPIGRATHGHAEQHIVDYYHSVLRNMDPSELNGKTIWMLIEQEPCSTCRQGLQDLDTSGGGVLKNFSQAYPQLRIEVKNLNSNELLVIQNGQLLNG